MAAFLAVALAAAPPAPAVRIGVDVHWDAMPGGLLRQALLDAVALQVPTGVEVTAVAGCDDVEFCITVVGDVIRLGAREGGYALTALVSRRLAADPAWPFVPPPEAAASSEPAPVVIEDAYTVEGGAPCAPCEAELDARDRTAELARAAFAKTMVEEGGLRLLVGPNREEFLRASAGELVRELREKHLEAWLARRAAAP